MFHLGRLRPYQQTFDYAGKALQGKHWLITKITAVKSLITLGPVRLVTTNVLWNNKESSLSKEYLTIYQVYDHKTVKSQIFTDFYSFYCQLVFFTGFTVGLDK